MTLREDILLDLVEFYQRHDPSFLRKRAVLNAQVDFALAQGLPALNAALLKKFGDQLGSGEAAVPTGSEKDVLRKKIEIFYLKHEPSKLDKADDVEAIVEWTTLYGVEKLNEKLEQKYGQKLHEVTESDIRQTLVDYYTGLGIVETKKEEDYAALIKWGKVHSFFALNSKLAGKYGKGFSQVSTARTENEIRDSLKSFYEVHDTKQLNDEQSFEFTMKWVLRNGVAKLNERLQQKYGANLNTFVKKAPLPIAAVSSNGNSKRGSNSVTEIDAEPTKEEEEVIEIDEERLNRIKMLSNFYLGKHDKDRLYHGGVADLMKILLENGEDYFNTNLSEEYGEDINATEAQYVELEEKFIQFYNIYDPEKIVNPKEEKGFVESVVGWSIVHGVGKINTKLMEKYDDDLEATGLKRKLALFYDKVNEQRTEVEISNIAEFGFRKGLKKLNKLLQKKYGTNLDDLFLLEEEESEEDYISDHEEDGIVGSPESTLVRPRQKSLAANEPRIDLPQLDSFIEQEAPMPEKEHKTDTQVANSLVGKLQKFYAKHDPAKGKDDSVVRSNMEFILQHGIKQFNRVLMDNYGESLNGAVGRVKSKSPFRPAFSFNGTIEGEDIYASEEEEQKMPMDKLYGAY